MTSIITIFFTCVSNPSDVGIAKVHQTLYRPGSAIAFVLWLSMVLEGWYLRYPA